VCARAGTAEITSVDPFAAPVRDSELELGFRDAVAREKECASAMKYMQRVVADLMKLRSKYVLLATPRECACARRPGLPQACRSG
jgi:hypothetical protein